MRTNYPLKVKVYDELIKMKISQKICTVKKKIIHVFCCLQKLQG